MITIQHHLDPATEHLDFMVGTIESVQKMETMNRMVHSALHVEAVRGRSSAASVLARKAVLKWDGPYRFVR